MILIIVDTGSWFFKEYNKEYKNKHHTSVYNTHIYSVDLLSLFLSKLRNRDCKRIRRILGV